MARPRNVKARAFHREEKDDNGAKHGHKKRSQLIIQNEERRPGKQAEGVPKRVSIELTGVSFQRSFFERNDVLAPLQT